MRVLVLGATGMLGHVTFRVVGEQERHEVWGSLRTSAGRRFFPQRAQSRLVDGVEVLDPDALVRLFALVKPDVVVNCVGLIKQLAAADDPLAVLPLNAMLPYRLGGLCGLAGARLVHISTDCVFSGRRGGYRETDVSDAEDLYGKSKFIGELRDCGHAVTLRTSIIGHELSSCVSLLDWFLSQRGQVKGYANAVFSGLPSVELATVIRDHVLPLASLSGVYHVSAAPISKLDLLRLIAAEYGKTIEIVPSHGVALDRSLNSDRFTEATGYVAPDWPTLIKRMRADRDSYETDTHV